MSNRCKTCKKIFSSKYNLEKHLNKQIPCGEFLQCNMCKKTFKIVRDLNNHMNRKNPCKPIAETKVNTEKELMLKLEIEKIKITEKKLEVEMGKIEVEKERLAFKKQESDRKLERDRIKENIELEKIVARNALEREKIAARDALEDKKMERKKNTVADINNNIKNNIHITNITNITNNIENKYFGINKLTINDLQYIENMHMDQFIYDPDVDTPDDLKRQHDLLKEIYTKSSNDISYCKNILTHFYNNPNSQENRCIFYNRKEDIFFGITVIDGEKKVTELEFDTDIKPQFINTVKRLLDILAKRIPPLYKNPTQYFENLDDKIKRMFKLDSLRLIKKNISEVYPEIKNISSDIFLLKV